MTKGLGLIAAVVFASVPVGGSALRGSPPPDGGTISIEARAADGNAAPSLPAFLDAVEEAMTARGFTVFDDPGHAASVAELVLSRADVGTGTARVPGQSTPSIAGSGVAVPLSTGQSELVRLRRTRLDIRIHRRGEAGLVWQGAAVTVREAGGRRGTDAIIAADLSRALLQSYPVVQKDVIGVP